MSGHDGKPRVWTLQVCLTRESCRCGAGASRHAIRAHLSSGPPPNSAQLARSTCVFSGWARVAHNTRRSAYPLLPRSPHQGFSMPRGGLLTSFSRQAWISTCLAHLEYMHPVAMHYQTSMPHFLCTIHPERARTHRCACAAAPHHCNPRPPHRNCTLLCPRAP